MQDLLDNNPLILMEAAIVEQLRRSGQVKLDEILVNAPLIYDPASRDIMANLYREYMDLAEQAGLPFIACTPTWRAGKERVQQAGISTPINQDAVTFLKEIRRNDNVRIGGQIGCKNDCYQPEAGLPAEEAERYHAWQLDQLAAADVDFLIAVTLPSVQEALGIARAMAATGLPAIISFVIGRDGHILDGTSLDAAIELIDNSTANSPLGYMINCAHPSFLHPHSRSQSTLGRLIGFQANASSLDHCELENADELQVDSIAEWRDLMQEFNRDYGVKILGGCCGTGIEHLQYLVGAKG